MSRRNLNGIDANNQKVVGVGDPTNPTDGVNKRFTRYDWPTGCVGKPLAAEAFAYLVVPIALILPANLPGSLARALTAANASATWTLYRIPLGSTTATSVATLNFAAGSTNGVFTLNADVAISVGDFLYWVAPTTQDSALSDIGILIAASR